MGTKHPSPSKSKSGSSKQVAHDADDETIYTRDEDVQECIDNCTDCAQVCEQMISHCLSRGGEHASPEHIRMLIDCMEACKTAVGFMLRGSDYHALTCGTCALICTACAENCEQMNDDELMQECIEICRRCATSCAAMSQMQ